MKSLFLALSLLISYTCSADEVKISEARTDAAQGVTDLSIVTNSDGEIKSIKYLVSTGLSDVKAVTQLEEGMVIAKFNDQDVLTLKSSSFDPIEGGLIDVIYLTNAITGSKKKLSIELNRSTGNWALSTNDNAGHQVFTHMFLKAKKVFGQVVGIDSIETSN